MDELMVMLEKHTFMQALIASGGQNHRCPFKREYDQYLDFSQMGYRLYPEAPLRLGTQVEAGQSLSPWSQSLL